MDLSKMSVLVVDDFSTMRHIVNNLLRQTGFGKVTEAEDGMKALRKLESGDFQFICSDWNMPNLTGLELLKAVRNSPQFKNIPFLMVTAEASKDNIVAAVQAGADGYIIKPFSAAILGEKIESILKRRRNG
jgi:two-component system chemotaxis response regulator CheY